MLSNALDSLFARAYDRFMLQTEKKGLADQRSQLLSGLDGDVLEIGAGTGANLRAYPATLRSLTLTEPSPQMASRLRSKAEGSRPDATIVAAPAEDLPFDDESFDAVVTTLVLCSVDDVAAAARELRRVLRPDGRLVVIEHVARPGGPSLPQRLWDPVQHVVGRNCHVTRDTRSVLRVAGFDTTALVDGVMPGAPGALFPTISGIAVPSA